MQLLKFGEVLRCFDNADLKIGATLELTNTFSNIDIPNSIIDGVLYNNHNRLTLSIDNDNGIISTSENLNYLQFSLNTAKALPSKLNKILSFKCKIHLADNIGKQDMVVIGDYNHISWVVIQINDNKLEFYNNDDGSILSNHLVKVLDIEYDRWYSFEIEGYYDEVFGFFKYNITIDGVLLPELSGITGEKRTASDYNYSSFDDGCVLFNVNPEKKFNKDADNILYGDIVMQRQYYVFIRKPLVTINKLIEDDTITLTPEVTVDGYYCYAGMDETYEAHWDDGTNGEKIIVLSDMQDDYQLLTYTVTDSLQQVTEATVFVDNIKSDDKQIADYAWCTTGQLQKTISFELSDIDNYKNFNYLVKDNSGDSIYGSILVSNDNNFTDDQTFIDTNLIDNILWSTNETTLSIVPGQIMENAYTTYYCTVTDIFGNKVTDSIILDNFIEPHNEIHHYIWDNGDLSNTRIIALQTVDEYGYYQCNATDICGNVVTGSILVENHSTYKDNEVVSYQWNTGETTDTIEVHKNSLTEQFVPYYCTVTDTYGNRTTDQVIVNNFTEMFPNSIVSYQWNTGETTQTINVQLSSFPEEYKVYTCKVTDAYDAEVSYTYVVTDYKTVADDYNTSLYWNTGETAQSILVDLMSIDQYQMYCCTVVDDFGRKTTDSVIVTNFPEISQSISGYWWNTNENTQSITVTKPENYDVYYCTAEDQQGVKVTDSIIVDGFPDITNQIVSYNWSTTETTQSITVNKDSVDQYQPIYCTAQDQQGVKVTDSIIVDAFPVITNQIVSYNWSTTETTQSITVNKDNVDQYEPIYCTAEDQQGVKVTDSIIVDAFPDITNQIVSYKWSTSETTQSITVNKDSVDQYQPIYCTAEDQQGVKVTDSIIIDNFTQPYNEIVEYRWHDGSTGQTFTLSKDNIIDYDICYCTVTDLYGVKTTDSAIIVEEGTESRDLTYLWDTGETTQTVTLNLSDVDEYLVRYCTVDDGYNSTTDSIVIDNFKPFTNSIVSYLWDTGETTQTITVDINNLTPPVIISCDVTDEINQTATGFVVASENYYQFTYLWSTGATTKSVIGIRKNGVYTVTVTNEVGHSETARIELEGLGDRPSVSVMANPASTEVGEPVTLTAVGSDLDGFIVKYRWYKLNDDGVTRTLLDETSDRITVTPETADDVYIVQVEDDDGYIAESLIYIDFIEFTDMLFYKYNNKQYIIPLYSVWTNDTINVIKNGKNLYAKYVDLNDIKASHIHVKINGDIKKLAKL